MAWHDKNYKNKKDSEDQPFLPFLAITVLPTWIFTPKRILIGKDKRQVIFIGYWQSFKIYKRYILLNRITKLLEKV